MHIHMSPTLTAGFSRVQLLLSKDIACLAVNIPPNRSPKGTPFHGLFDVRHRAPDPPRRETLTLPPARASPAFPTCAASGQT